MATIKTAFEEFDVALRHHPDGERMVLFPDFEHTPGTPSGPTGMMRSEHRHIKEITAAMTDSLSAHDADAFAASVDLLHMMPGQRMLQESSTLYPVADCSFAACVDQLDAQVRDLRHPFGEHQS
ncbi:hemerythrin domain-containing protein [Noviherbaspirillum sp.]|uniref:hemerythrin domain-containing protein n=1 Tax=Noviherbaspirillum sp. TaxID=1926288 RepID=UPI002FE290D6